MNVAPSTVTLPPGCQPAALRSWREKVAPLPSPSPAARWASSVTAVLSKAAWRLGYVVPVWPRAVNWYCCCADTFPAASTAYAYRVWVPGAGGVTVKWQHV
ncbi:hypothetical protein QD712_35165 [Streptomyces acidiscabies]|uniref:hypothetical protein n=1 Tax=Streptomyces acidiscabies TaxID=42234 RepID=UPI0030D4C315